MKFKETKAKDNTFKKLGKNPKFREHAECYKKRIDLSVVVFQKREELKLSQAKLAKKLGISQRIISNIEQGDYNPGFDMLVKIADALALPFFLGEHNFAKHSPAVTKEKETHHIHFVESKTVEETQSLNNVGQEINILSYSHNDNQSKEKYDKASKFYSM